MLEQEQVENDEILGQDFCIETHLADAMGSAHWHDHIELNYLWSGTLIYLINGRRHQLKAGQICVFWAATPHQVLKVDDNQMLSCAYLPLSTFLSLNLNPDFRHKIMKGNLLSSNFADPADAHNFERWTREWEEGHMAQHLILEEEIQVRLKRLSWAHREMLGDSEETAPITLNSSKRAIEHVERMAGYIQEEFTSGITPVDVVANAGLHRSKASEAFREILGLSIGEYIKRHRLRHAMRQLVETDLDVAHIAFECGYQSLSRFYAAFKQRTRLTPLAYRAECRSTM